MELKKRQKGRFYKRKKRPPSPCWKSQFFFFFFDFLKNREIPPRILTPPIENPCALTAPMTCKSLFPTICTRKHKLWQYLQCSDRTFQLYNRCTGHCVLVDTHYGSSRFLKILRLGTSRKSMRKCHPREYVLFIISHIYDLLSAASGLCMVFAYKMKIIHLYKLMLSNVFTQTGKKTE